jgi:hypothetical protein
VNAALASRTGDRRQFRRRQGQFGILDCCVGIHDRPHKSDDDSRSVGHVSKTDTAHDAVSGRVLGKSVDKNFWDTKGVDQFLVWHGSYTPQLHAKVRGQSSTCVGRLTQVFQIGIRCAASSVAHQNRKADGRYERRRRNRNPENHKKSTCVTWGVPMRFLFAINFASACKTFARGPR